MRIINILLLGSGVTAQLGPGTPVEEDTGQVSIHAPPSEADTSYGAVAATVFRSVPGPKACRGSPMAQLAVPLSSANAAEVCFDLPSPAGCAVFVAARENGCEARLFVDRGCVNYVNTAVFTPEPRPVGGRFRSVGLRCGVPAPDPESLGAPPLVGMFKVHDSSGKQE